MPTNHQPPRTINPLPPRAEALLLGLILLAAGTHAAAEHAGAGLATAVAALGAAVIVIAVAFANRAPSPAPDPWEGPTGREVLAHLHRTNPGLAREVERGRSRSRRAHQGAPQDQKTRAPAPKRLVRAGSGDKRVDQDRALLERESISILHAAQHNPEGFDDLAEAYQERMAMCWRGAHPRARALWRADNPRLVRVQSMYHRWHPAWVHRWTRCVAGAALPPHVYECGGERFEPVRAG